MKKIISAVVAVGMCISFSANSFAAGMGVGTHISYLYSIDDNVNCAIGAEVEWIRDQSSWESVETEKGVYAIKEHTFNGIKKIKKEGFSLLLGLNYGNTLYTPESKFVMPTQDNEEYYNAFLNYVEFQLKELKDYVDAWEVWNEPNWEKFNYYGTSGREYAKLYLDCAELIRKYDPTAKLVCGVVMGHSGYNLQYGKDIFAYLQSQGDVNELMDIFSIHKYTNDAEGEYVKALNTWESVFDTYGYTGDVWMTENGASSYIDTEDDTNSLTEEQQATYIARYGVQWERFLMNNNRKGEVFWYDMKNDGTDINEKEHNYGLVDDLYNPKPAFYAAKIYNNLTNNKEMVSYEENGTGYVAEYSDGVDKVYVLYDTYGTQNVELSGDVAHVYDYIGNLTETIDTPSGIKSIEVTGEPVYIECVSDSLKFTYVKYNDNKNILEIAGLAPDVSDVTITFEQDGVAVQTVTAKVSDDTSFKKTLSVDVDGDCTLKLNDGTRTVEKEMSFAKNPANNTVGEITDSVVAYDTETRKGTVSATVFDAEDGEIVSMAVVSSDKDISELSVLDFEFLADSVVYDNTVSIEFTLPENFKGEYKILLGRKGLETPNSDGIFIANKWNWTYVSDVNVSESNGNINIQVNLSNHNDLPKGATIISAQYLGNKLLKLTTSEVTVPAGQKTSIVKTLDVTKEINADKIKVFVWGSYSTLIPLCEVK